MHSPHHVSSFDDHSQATSILLNKGASFSIGTDGGGTATQDAGEHRRRSRSGDEGAKPLLLLAAQAGHLGCTFAHPSLGGNTDRHKSKGVTITLYVHCGSE